MVLVGLCQRAQLEEELVAVRRSMIEDFLERLGRLGPGAALGGQEIEGVRQEQATVVVPVVARKPVGDRRLGRGGLQGRVGVDHPARRVEARVGDPPQADPAVVVRHVLDQPVDRVKRVAALVDVARTALLGPMGGHIDELALRHPAPAHVLVDEDVSLLAEGGRRTQVGLGTGDPVGLHAIRRPGHEDRVALGRVLGDIHRREQPHAVAHRNAVLVLRVVRLDILDALRGGVASGEDDTGHDGGEQDPTRRECDEPRHRGRASETSPYGMKTLGGAHLTRALRRFQDAADPIRSVPLLPCPS